MGQASLIIAFIFSYPYLLFPFFVCLVTRTTAKLSQCRTRLENKSGSHERQQHGDFGAHRLISRKPLNNRCSAAFSHSQQWAKNEPLVQLPSNLGQGKVIQTCGSFGGRMIPFQFPPDHGPKLASPISSAYYHLVLRSMLNLSVSFNSSLNLAFSGLRVPRPNFKPSSDNLLKPPQNFSNNLSQRWNRSRVGPLEVKSSSSPY